MITNDDWVYLSEHEERVFAQIVLKMIIDLSINVTVVDMNTTEAMRAVLMDMFKFKQRGGDITVARMDAFLDVLDVWTDWFRTTRQIEIPFQHDGNAIGYYHGSSWRYIDLAHQQIQVIWRTEYLKHGGNCEYLGSFKSWLAPNRKKVQKAIDEERDRQLRYIDALITEHPDWTREELWFRVSDCDLVKDLIPEPVEPTPVTPEEEAEAAWLSELDEQERRHALAVGAYALVS